MVLFLLLDGGASWWCRAWMVPCWFFLRDIFFFHFSLLFCTSSVSHWWRQLVVQSMDGPMPADGLAAMSPRPTSPITPLAMRIRPARFLALDTTDLFGLSFFCCIFVILIFVTHESRTHQSHKSACHEAWGPFICLSWHYCAIWLPRLFLRICDSDILLIFVTHESRPTGHQSHKSACHEDWH